MKHKAAFPLLFAVAVHMTPVSAEERNDVQNLINRCDTLGVDQGYCIGYVGGVSDMMSMNCFLMREGSAVDPRVTADTNDVSYGAAVQAFRNWAEQNPQAWSAAPLTGILLALSKTFPCNV